MLNHTDLESTVRYLGIEAVDALRLAEQQTGILDWFVKRADLGVIVAT